MSKLWLWKNFVDGRPEYWAFDNPYPCHPNCDPMVFGEPCGYAIFKPSQQGRFDVSEAEVIANIKRASCHMTPNHTEGWRPIETAPKDMTQEQRLLGYSPSEGVRIVRYSGWGGGTGPFEYEGTLGDGLLCWVDIHDLTHWMPLPDPPQ